MSIWVVSTPNTGQICSFNIFNAMVNSFACTCVSATDLPHKTLYINATKLKKAQFFSSFPNTGGHKNAGLHLLSSDRFEHVSPHGFPSNGNILYVYSHIQDFNTRFPPIL